MKQATKENLSHACRTCKTPEGTPCKPPSPAFPDSERNVGHVHGSRARLVRNA